MNSIFDIHTPMGRLNAFLVAAAVLLAATGTAKAATNPPIFKAVNGTAMFVHPRCQPTGSGTFCPRASRRYEVMVLNLRNERSVPERLIRRNLGISKPLAWNLTRAVGRDAGIPWGSTIRPGGYVQAIIFVSVPR